MRATYKKLIDGTPAFTVQVQREVPDVKWIGEIIRQQYPLEPDEEEFSAYLRDLAARHSAAMLAAKKQGDSEAELTIQGELTAIAIFRSDEKGAQIIEPTQIALEQEAQYLAEAKSDLENQLDQPVPYTLILEGYGLKAFAMLARNWLQANRKGPDGAAKQDCTTSAPQLEMDPEKAAQQKLEKDFERELRGILGMADKKSTSIRDSARAKTLELVKVHTKTKGLAR